MNIIIISGKVERNPELSYSANGFPKLKFSVVTIEEYRDRAKQIQTSKTYHNCDMWGQDAEVMRHKVFAGSTVTVDGAQKHEGYTDKTGTKKTRSYISVKHMEVTGVQLPETHATPSVIVQPEMAVFDDSLPF